MAEQEGKEQKPKIINENEVNTTAYSWIVAILVMLSYAVSFVSRNVWTVAMPIAIPEMGLSMTLAGGLMTAYYIGYVISNFITGFMVDRVGPRLTLSLATILTGIFTILIPFAPNYWSIAALRVLAGASSGPLFACVVKYQISWFSPQFRATAMGLMMAGPAVGGSIANLIFAPIVTSQGWRQGFFYAALTCVVVAVLVYFMCKEQGASAMRSNVTDNQSAEDKALQSAGLKSVIFKRSFILGTFACFLSIGINMVYTTYILTYFTSVRGFEMVTASMIIGSTGMLGLVTGIVAGMVSDIIGSKKICIYIGVAVCFVCTLLIMTASSTPILIAVICLRLLGAAFMGNSLNALQAQAAVGPFAGRSMGFYNGVAQAGSIVFPLVFGVILDLTDLNYSLMFYGMAAAILVFFVLVFFMDEKKVVRASKAKVAEAE